MLSTATKNSLLTTLAGLVTHYSLHSAFPGDNGANEINGGDPAYARKAAGWNAAAGGSLGSSAGVTFDVPGGATVAWLGFWDAGSAGNYRGCAPLGGNPKDFAVDPATDTVRLEGHGYADGTKVVFFGGTPPAPLVEGTIYFVRDAATDTFKLAATEGGAAIDITNAGDNDVLVSKVVPETYGAQGTYALNSTTIALLP